MNWNEMIQEFLTDAGKLVATTPTITHIVGIVQWNGKIVAHSVYQPSPIDIVGDETGTAVQGMSFMPEPPTGWTSVSLKVSPKVNGVPTAENMPVMYYVMGKDFNGLAIPSRFNSEGKIGYSHNPEMIDYVEAELTKTGVLVVMPRAERITG